MGNSHPDVRPRYGWPEECDRDLGIYESGGDLSEARVNGLRMTVETVRWMDATRARLDILRMSEPNLADPDYRFALLDRARLQRSDKPRKTR